MAWVQLSGDAAQIAVKPDGKIIWNEGANNVLCNPKHVELFYDAEDNRLGFRKARCGASTGALSVYYQQGNNCFAIDSTACLESAEISVDEIWAQEPQEPDAYDPEVSDVHGVWWIALPN